MMKKSLVVLMGPCYRVPVLLVKLADAYLVLADRSFRVAIAKANALLVGCLF